MGATKGLLLLLGVSGLVGLRVTEQELPTSDARRDHVIVVAMSQLGVREATQNNDGPEVEKILATTGNTKGQSWCGSFNYACYTWAGEKLPKGPSAWSPSWVPKARRIWEAPNDVENYKAKPADTFGVYYTSLRRVGHTGMIVKRDSRAWVVTIEGNTNGMGSREGNGVYLKRRRIDQLYAVARWIN